MARKESKENSFADLVARLKEMSNSSPEQERAELMEAANKEPKILDDKDISLADIAKLAEDEDHHPAILLEWGSVRVQWWSHKIKGLHMNDFICAAKTETLIN